MRRFLAMVVLSSCVGHLGDLDADLDVGSRDAGPVDSGPNDFDAGLFDAGAVDAGAVDAGAVDAGAVDAGAIDAGAVDAGTVFHVVIAAGWGGRRVRSCDDGETWGANVQEADESQDDWHRSYTPKALTFAAGKFIFLSGWGTASTAWVTSDATNWRARVLSTSYGGLGFSDGRFVLVGNRQIGVADVTAENWGSLPMATASTYDRGAAAFDGIWAAGSDGNLQVQRTSQSTWQAVTACRGVRHTGIGFQGGFALGNGRLVSLGDDGDVCVINSQTGLHVANASFGVAAGGSLVFDGTQFLAAAGDRLMRSRDGLAWSTQMLPIGVRFQLVTRSPSGRLIGVAKNSRGAWFSNDDGATWQPSSNLAPGNELLYLASGNLGACP